MKRLIELANKIKDKDLRKKTVEILNNPKLSNRSFKYKASKFSEIPAWAVGAHHHYKGGEAEHTESMTEISIVLAKHFNKKYKAKINMDHVIAGALLHDIGKVFIIKKEGNDWGFTGTVMDHADLSACELYARGFPEEVVHIVAAHGGDGGSDNAAPRTLEATIILRADVIDSEMESNINNAEELEDQIKLILSGIGD